MHFDNENTIPIFLYASYDDFYFTHLIISFNPLTKTKIFVDTKIDFFDVTAFHWRYYMESCLSLQTLSPTIKNKKNVGNR